MRYLVHLVTDLGDAALIIPASAMLLAYLLYIRSTRTAAVWAATLALCAGLTFLAKLLLYTCGSDMPLADLHSPSGHTSVSVTFYGCCALMMSTDKERWTRLLLLAGGAAIGVAVAASRVVLEAHTVTDVVVGFTIGAFCVLWFATRYFAKPGSPLPWELAALAISIVILVMHGSHWTVEHAIAHIAALLHANMRLCA
jgi:membrane-associated phospholipid phosphatase